MTEPTTNGVVPAVKATQVHKAFGSLHVLKGVDMTVMPGSVTVILGPSGSGKTTLMNIIGCLDKPTKGTFLLNGEDIAKCTENEMSDIRLNKIGFVFQSFHLLPRQSAISNVEMPLNYAHVPKKERRERAFAALDRVGLADRVDFRPNQLSGGQMQRVAIARAIVNRPQVLLLDEPLGALDLKLRKDMQIELKRIQQQVGITFVYVTHDQEEALTMSDTVVVMNEGRIQQIGTPQDIYNEPKNAFVADFIGESNIIDGIMHEDRVVGMYGKKFPCLDGGFQPNEPVDVVIRPEDIDIVPVEQGQLTGTVTEVTFKGMHYDIIVDFKGFKWLIQTTDFSPVGARIGVKIDPDGFHIMKKSRYSGMFGDYSSYSSEYDELNEGPEEGNEDEE